ncbi:MAG: SusC/RagA family TonB-linked outer membrane protein, partial [Bacteroidales bacterium]|nr:SusC/RagA family TonB-linked outer membrane protein [Bacteroidales bacterium]
MKQIWIIFLLAVCTVASVRSQQEQEQFTVSGTVSDETGFLPGVTIYAKNQPGVGTTTDVNGKFSLKVFKGNTVVFSFIGYEEVQHFADRSVSDLKIVMKESATALEEVVIGALGTTQAKATTTGALGTIDTKQLQVPATSMANILGGRMPGIITMQESGEPGNNISEFWIRGIGTFGANDKALVLIDGLEGDLDAIDPADIESFSILKDASATAVYGVRGANGVVLITTKRGEEGRIQLSARANFTMSKLQRMPNYLRSYDYALLVNEAYQAREMAPKYTGRELEVIQYGLDRDLYPDVDWQDEIFNPVSLQQTYYLNARGGGSIAKYFISLGTSTETAAYKMDPDVTFPVKTGYNTYSFRMNLDINLTKTTKVYFSTDGYLTRRVQPGIENTNQLWFSLSSVTPLLVPKVYSTGHIPSYGENDSMSPYVMMNYLGTRSENINTYKSSIELKQDLSAVLDGLTFRVQGAFDSKVWYNEYRYTIPELWYANTRNVDGQLQLAKTVERLAARFGYGQRQFRKYYLESTLNYNKLFAEKHRFMFLVYYSMSDSKDTNDITSSGINLSMAAIPKRYQGVSSRLTYGYRDTYMVDFNFGYTG